ncbi:MAG: substrate-binding domain-containing protein [Planctomycetota bacterium]|jgi:phosphonate transport system substrate-binding protein
MRFALPSWSWALLLLVLGLSGCGQSEEGVPISLNGGEPDAPLQVEKVDEFRFGIGAMISPGATLELYGRLVEALARRLGRRGVAIQRRTYQEINDLLEQRQLDCALVCTGAYLAGRRKFGMEPLVVPLFDGKPVYHSIVIARRGSGIAEFVDLKGLRFAFVDPLSNTGRLYPVSRVLGLGSTPQEFFRYEYTHGHDRSIAAVRAGVVDGAAVDGLVFSHLERTDPSMVSGLEVIERSPPYGAPPVAVHPLTPSSTRSRLRLAFLSLSESEEGRQVLSELGVDGFEVPPSDLYDSAAALERTVRRSEEESSGR